MVAVLIQQIVVPIATLVVGAILGAILSTWYSNYVKRPILTVTGSGGGGGVGAGYWPIRFDH
jgi:hypothetical protein